jgi:hypothetical protein
MKLISGRLLISYFLRENVCQKFRRSVKKNKKSDKRRGEGTFWRNPTKTSETLANLAWLRALEPGQSRIANGRPLRWQGEKIDNEHQLVTPQAVQVACFPAFLRC